MSKLINLSTENLAELERVARLQQPYSADGLYGFSLEIRRGWLPISRTDPFRRQYKGVWCPQEESSSNLLPRMERAVEDALHRAIINGDEGRLFSDSTERGGDWSGITSTSHNPNPITFDQIREVVDHATSHPHPLTRWTRNLFVPYERGRFYAEAFQRIVRLREIAQFNQSLSRCVRDLSARLGGIEEDIIDVIKGNGKKVSPGDLDRLFADIDSVLKENAE
jgi:hypothetical protein